MPAEDPRPPASTPALTHWSVRLRDAASTYLPLLLMLLLAGATWWLVRLTPVPPAIASADPAPTAPDYTLQGVDVVRYRPDGTVLARMRGRELRHYPVDDRLELDDAVIDADAPEGSWSAQSLRAVATQGGNRVLLMGPAQVRRAATGPQAAFEIQGQDIEVDVDQASARSDQPAAFTQDGVTVTATGFHYVREPGEVHLVGPVRAHWPSPVSKGSGAR